MRLNNCHIDIETVAEYTKDDANFTFNIFDTFANVLVEIEADVVSQQRETDQNLEFLDKLEISYGFNDGPSVSLNELVGILKDEKRLKKIVAMLKNKAFW